MLNVQNAKCNHQQLKTTKICQPFRNFNNFNFIGKEEYIILLIMMNSNFGQNLHLNQSKSPKCGRNTHLSKDTMIGHS